VDLDCKRFRAGIITAQTARATLSFVFYIMVTSSIQVFTHEKYAFGAGEKAALAGFALQNVDNRIWFFFIVL